MNTHRAVDRHELLNSVGRYRRALQNLEVNSEEFRLGNAWLDNFSDMIRDTPPPDGDGAEEETDEDDSPTPMSVWQKTLLCMGVAFIFGLFGNMVATVMMTKGDTNTIRYRTLTMQSDLRDIQSTLDTIERKLP